MTDDWAIIEEFQALQTGLTIHSFCHPQSGGYFQSLFEKLSPEDKCAHISVLLAEVEIAAASQIFIGTFFSNVSRYVPLVHRDPRLCLPAACMTAWDPG